MDTSIFPDEHHYHLTDIYMSGADKLRSLAVQIGESCLTNDLAALLAHRRDFELERHARGYSEELAIVLDWRARAGAGVNVKP